MTRARSHRAGPLDKPIWLREDIPMVVPPLAGPYHPDPSGYLVSTVGIMSSEGWKLHLTARPHNAAAFAALVLPVLTQLGVKHKYLHPAKLATRSGTDVGKFIAIYPTSAAQAHTIKIQLTPHLVGHEGPRVPGEMAFGPSNLLFARYGSFVYEYVKGPSGTNTKSLDSARGIRPYHRGTIRPSWIPDLTIDQSPTAFPIYDARRTLHYLPESDVHWV